MSLMQTKTAAMMQELTVRDLAYIIITIMIVVISLWTGELCRTATDKTEGEKSLFSTFRSRMEQTVVSGEKKNNNVVHINVHSFLCT